MCKRLQAPLSLGLSLEAQAASTSLTLRAQMHIFEAGGFPQNRKSVHMTKKTTELVRQQGPGFGESGVNSEQPLLPQHLIGIRAPSSSAHSRTASESTG